MLPPSPDSNPDAGTGRASPVRRRRVLIISSFLLVFLAFLFIPQAFDLRLQRPNIETTWLLFLLSTLSFISTLTLTIVLVRQLLKLQGERRANLLGSKFKTRLVAGALGLSLIPVVCMFAFTYGLMNHTLEKWFSRPVERVRDDTLEISALLERQVENAALVEASALQQLPLAARLVEHDAGALKVLLDSGHIAVYGGFAAVVTPDGSVAASANAPVPDSELQRRLTAVPAHGGPLEFPPLTYRVVREPLAPNGEGGLSGQLVVGVPIPAPIAAKVAQLRLDADEYNQLDRERRSLRRLYTSYLVLVTIAILFAATWIALFLSKLITLPIQALAVATQEIAQGNLRHRIRVRAPDELGALITSFNLMVGELESNRAQLEASRYELQGANVELERRRRYTETLLESIPSGVISLDRGLQITRTNPALERLLGPRVQQARQLEDLFEADSRQELQHLLRKAERLGVVAGQLEIRDQHGGRMTVAATVAPVSLPATEVETAPLARLRRPPHAGFVLVLEDLTDLLQMQRAAAWREVAQRIAHEIRNPLTPIALSAQRIQRRLAGEEANDIGGDGTAHRHETRRIIAECTALIASEIASLQHLVGEFSAFARFPAPHPVTCSLNEVISGALRVFEGRLEGTQIRTELGTLPPMLLDAEGMKRVFVNLIDNAAEAVHSVPYRDILITTSSNEHGVEAMVADTGHGILPGDKERLFLPYVSSKGRGTGLGLAIVARIVEEHGGSIRVEENDPAGTRFIIELPVVEAGGGEARASTEPNRA